MAQRHHQQNKKLPLYSKLIYGIIIIFFSYILLEYYKDNYSLQDNKAEIYATVYNVDVSSGLRGKKIFEYYYFINNKKYSTYDFLDDYNIRVGDRIRIIYDKKHPNNSKVVYRKLKINSK